MKKGKLNVFKKTSLIRDTPISEISDFVFFNG